MPVADVGPFFEQDPVISLDFAVGLWPVGARELRCCSEVFERGPPELGSVAGSVVGDDAFDGDAELVEELVGAVPETDGGDGLFVRMDLGVDDSGAVIERGV